MVRSGRRSVRSSAFALRLGRFSALRVFSYVVRESRNLGTYQCEDDDRSDMVIAPYGDALFKVPPPSCSSPQVTPQQGVNLASRSRSDRIE